MALQFGQGGLQRGPGRPESRVMEISEIGARSRVGFQAINDVVTQVMERVEDVSEPEMVTHLLQQLHDTPEGDGTMLDNAVVVYGSPMGNPNQHNHKRVPFLLAGHAGGRIRGGTHVRAAAGTPAAC